MTISDHDLEAMILRRLMERDTSTGVDAEPLDLTWEEAPGYFGFNGGPDGDWDRLYELIDGMQQRRLVSCTLYVTRIDDLKITARGAEVLRRLDGTAIAQQRDAAKEEIAADKRAAQAEIADARAVLDGERAELVEAQKVLHTERDAVFRQKLQLDLRETRLDEGRETLASDRERLAKQEDALNDARAALAEERKAMKSDAAASARQAATAMKGAYRVRAAALLVAIVGVMATVLALSHSALALG